MKPLFSGLLKTTENFSDSIGSYGGRPLNSGFSVFWFLVAPTEQIVLSMDATETPLKLKNNYLGQFFFNSGICESIFSKLGRDIQKRTLVSCSSQVRISRKIIDFYRK